MKENTKKYFNLSLILYVVILCFAVVGTLAWFIFDRSVEITPEDNATILAGKNIEICINDGTDKWGNSIKLQKIEKMPDVSMTPDGTFWFPTALNDDDTLKTGDAGKGFYKNVTSSDGYFVKIPLKVKSNKAINIYLDSTSFVKGVSIVRNEAETEEGETLAATTNNKDAIAGAARVAFFERSGETKQLKTVWEPNERYQFIDGVGDADYVLFDGAVRPMKYLNVVGNTVPTGEETIQWDTDVVSVGKNSLASRYVFEDGTEHIDVKDAKILLEFEQAGVKELDIYIWIEGTDDESLTFLSEGSISYEIKFVGVDEKSEPEINIEDVVFTGDRFKFDGEDISDQILWSKDGVNWTIFSPEGNPNIANIKYVRIKETATTKLGPAIALEELAGGAEDTDASEESK